MEEIPDQLHRSSAVQAGGSTTAPLCEALIAADADARSLPVSFDREATDYGELAREGA
jgi:hypothetical protein